MEAVKGIMEKVMPKTITSEGEVLEPTSIVVHEAVVLPAVSVEKALESFKLFQELKTKILGDEDKQKIGDKEYLVKSAWRKYAFVFNLTTELAGEKRIQEGDGTTSFEVSYRAIAPNGRSSVGDGLCNDEEKKDRNGNPIKNSLHNTRGTAHTRAFNRAVSNLIGGGEVSYEEIEMETNDSRPVHKKNSVQKSVETKEFRFEGGQWGPKGKKNSNNPLGLSFDEIPYTELVDHIQWMEGNTAKLKWNQPTIDAFYRWDSQRNDNPADSGWEGRRDPSEPPPNSDEDIPPQFYK